MTYYVYVIGGKILLMALVYPPGWSKEFQGRFLDGYEYPIIDGKEKFLAEWRAWYSARTRCHVSHSRQWRNYGARGIFMAPEWFMNFPAFLAHIGPKPSDAYSLDRIDNDKGYVPGNVRWATAEIQHANRRHPSRWIKPGGLEVDDTDLSPGQRRIAKATATRMRMAEEKKAADLRDRGWIVISPEVAAANAQSKLVDMASRGEN